MTTTEKAITRETMAKFQGRPILVQLEGSVIRLRQKGLRSQGWMTYPIETLFVEAARAALGK